MITISTFKRLNTEPTYTDTDTSVSSTNTSTTDNNVLFDNYESYHDDYIELPFHAIYVDPFPFVPKKTFKPYSRHVFYIKPRFKEYFIIRNYWFCPRIKINNLTSKYTKKKQVRKRYLQK